MKRTWYMVIGSLLVGLIIGILSSQLFTKQERDSKAFELHQGGNQLINPLLQCEVGGEAIDFDELIPFKEELKVLVDSLKAKGWIDYSAVYFRDLNNGPWFGINIREKFIPASLFKVPLMIAYFKEAEKNPGILKESIKFENLEDANRGQNFKSSVTIQPGGRYTVEELIMRAITYSDNNAAQLLLRHLDREKVFDIFLELGVPSPLDAGDEDIMTVKQYATFFRVLFNASYLDHAMSIKALELLSKTEFRDGIVAGVPPTIQVVHKFGERARKDNKKQMHDCGIVYYPQHPYLICIMTKGDSFERLDDSIRQISSFVFKNVDNQLKNR